MYTNYITKLTECFSVLVVEMQQVYLTFLALVVGPSYLFRLSGFTLKI